MKKYFSIIIGAGFAGASTAYHLSRMTEEKVLVLERESQPGQHASGQNAAMIRQVVPHIEIARMAKASAAFYAHPSEDFSPFVFQPRGSLLIGEGEGMVTLRATALQLKEEGLETSILSSQECLDRFPHLETFSFQEGIWTPGDGTVDLYEMISAYVSAARKSGAEVLYNAEVKGIVREDGGFIIETSQGAFRCSSLVNAGGAWAGGLGKMAGFGNKGLQPTRRHLFVTEETEGIHPEDPFIWDVTDDFYFRPEKGGVMICGCDQNNSLPCVPEVNEVEGTRVLEKARKRLPFLKDISLGRSSAGLRTLSPDASFVLGWDKNERNFFWLSALGGHGVTTSYEVGRMAARSILRPRKNNEIPEAFSPGRFE